MKADLCCSRFVVGPGRRAVKRPFKKPGTATIACRSSAPLPSRRRNVGSVCISRFITKTFAHRTSLNFLPLCIGICVAKALWFGIDTVFIARQLVNFSAGRQTDWFDFEPLPAYAPELNPVEFVWNHTKYAKLANYIPEDIIDLKTEVDLTLETNCNNQTFLRSCFGFAKLRL